MPTPRILLRAEHLLRHPEELLSMLAKALAKAYSKRTILLHLFEDFLLLFRLVRSWVKGEYRDVPRKTIFWSVLAILYFLSPLDLIPDLLPGGYLDDIAFISFVLRRIRGDLDTFTSWEKAKQQS